MADLESELLLRARDRRCEILLRSVIADHDLELAFRNALLIQPSEEVFEQIGAVVNGNDDRELQWGAVFCRLRVRLVATQQVFLTDT